MGFPVRIVTRDLRHGTTFHKHPSLIRRRPSRCSLLHTTGLAIPGLALPPAGSRREEDHSICSPAIRVWVEQYVGDVVVQAELHFSSTKSYVWSVVAWAACSIVNIQLTIDVVYMPYFFGAWHWKSWACILSMESKES